ncbi:MAG: GNAT family N-acetyltransferase [Rhodobacteraceae bacterium]|nr:GNAT family N-acetyltransferase [Paracoccaceae bacterium]
MTLAFETTDTPAADDLATLNARLTAFNDADVGASGRRALAVFQRDAEGEIVAGLSGYTAWGWLYVQWLWVGEALRGQGVAGQMLTAAEAEAKARGCHGALIDTFSPVARRTYERQGYQCFGIVEDFPPGRSRIYLQKRLA